MWIYTCVAGWHMFACEQINTLLLWADDHIFVFVVYEHLLGLVFSLAKIIKFQETVSKQK